MGIRVRKLIKENFDNVFCTSQLHVFVAVYVKTHFPTVHIFLGGSQSVFLSFGRKLRMDFIVIFSI